MTEDEYRRMLWRCRRGLLELDIVLKRFVEQDCAGLSATQLHAFEELLDLPDNSLWELVCRRAYCQDQLQQEILAKLAGFKREVA
jgi:antitoxin CptB